jgi:hypothetical protein
MMRFIALHNHVGGGLVFVNMATIRTIVDSPTGGSLITIGATVPLKVKEDSGQVFTIMRQASETEGL